jgi:Ala-tRNA(Pro) deacylase
MIAEELRQFLESRGTRYHVYEHEPCYTAQEIANSVHVSGKHFAKTVLIRVDEEPETLALAVLPGHERIDFTRLGRQLGHAVALASEEVVQQVFPSFELGAAPPIAALASRALSAVLVDADLAKEDLVAFNGGTLTGVVEMQWAEFARLTQPRLLDYGSVAARSSSSADAHP